MSYICESCNEHSVGVPTQKIIETRKKAYPMRMKDNEVIDKGGNGWEIVKEILVCSECK